MEDSLHYINKAEYICTKKELPGLFNPVFYAIYEIWNLFHHGFKEDLKDPEIISTVIHMENVFNQHFSEYKGFSNYMDAIINRLDVYMGRKKR